jgi:anti-sigma regulatory factor (Ser/Thr protein kinase)
MDGMIEAISVPVVDETQPAEARRAAGAMSKLLGFDETTAGRVAIVVTEAATNIVKHGGGGEILIRPLQDEDESGIEVVALDKGPGIANLAESRIDGVSRTGSAGGGLGAIGRLADLHDIYSLPGRGTAVLLRIWQSRRTMPPRSPLAVAGVGVAKPGESMCGDAWTAEPHASGAILLLADGLGHGPQAAEASREAIRIFQKRGTEAPVAILRFAHDALRSTRGAAVAIADIDCQRRVITFAGIGNIAGTVFLDAARRNMVSQNGTLGHTARTFSEFTYEWTPGAIVVLHSDGLTSHWSLDGYPGIGNRDPALIAAVLYRDFSRGRDDVTVVVARAVGT